MKEVAKRVLNGLGYELKKKKSGSFKMFEQFLNQRSTFDIGRKNDLESRFLKFLSENYLNSNAQLFQDLLVHFLLNKRHGVFCEFGACDGITLSNSLYLEQKLGWTGILAEPARQWKSELLANRPGCLIDTRCVFKQSGDHVNFIEAADGEYSSLEDYTGKDTNTKFRQDTTKYEVLTISLNDLLSHHNIEKLDYLSVDTEGSEYQILKAFDFGLKPPTIITVEHNFTSTRDDINVLLTSKGYVRIMESFSQFDDWFIQSAVLQEFQKETLEN